MFLELFIKQKRIGKNKPIFPFSRQRVGQITREVASINPHAFRHSYAIHLLRVSKNVRYVQKQLGHSSLKTTEIYLQFMEFNHEQRQLDELY